jgi:hypothetical protein
MTRALALAALLTCSAALADEPAPPPPPATSAAAQRAERGERLKQIFKDWWVWSLGAVLSAGTIITSVVVATVPRGSANPSPPAGTMALTVRF